MTASDFGAPSGKGPLPVGLVLATTFQADASWNPIELTPAQGALALLANALSARRRPAGTISTLEKKRCVMRELCEENAGKRARPWTVFSTNTTGTQSK